MLDTSKLKKGTYILICNRQEAFITKTYTKKYPNSLQIQYLQGGKAVVNLSDVSINEEKTKYKVTLASW